MKLVKDRKNGCCKGKFFSMLTCFAAGMLLTISLAHILPEATAMYGEYLEHLEEEGETGHRLLEEKKHDEHEEGKFPLPSIIFFLGFMFMLLLDQIIFKRDEAVNTIPTPIKEKELEA